MDEQLLFKETGEAKKKKNNNNVCFIIHIIQCYPRFCVRTDLIDVTKTIIICQIIFARQIVYKR